MYLRLFLIFTIFMIILPPDVWAEELPTSENGVVQLSSQDMQKRFWQTTLAGVGLVTAWGVWQWDYFSRSPHTESEGWFGRDTESGGADKAGHAYTTYVFSHALSYLYKYWGFEKDSAALYGAASSLAIMSYMEFGDSFSDFGASYEDMLANGVGALLGYVLFKNEDLASKIDFRWEYTFDGSQFDITTDYENSRYLLALKLNGFESLRNTAWRHLELHVGYYTRNFDDVGDRERNLYFGVGVNLTDLLYRHSWKKTATVLRYIQLPYTSITARHNFD